ncbi:MAG: cytochrome c biogenesis factor, partial [Planctomycetota bacterium]
MTLSRNSNATPGGHWIAIDLRGTIGQDKKTRSNNSAIGARVEIKTGAVLQQFTVGNMSGPAAQTPLRIHAGLGPNTKVDWLRIIWPDGVLQAELELPADRVHQVAELQRKTSSCPVLFAWDGQQFRFVADFGGVGGLGYWIGPGKYAAPDPTEQLLLPALEPRDGHYELRCLTPLEETTYLDRVELVAVDHPEGTHILPHERMAVRSAPPPDELFCFAGELDPIRARDHLGRDVTGALAEVDRICAGCTHPDSRFHGVADEHWVELDFGDRLRELSPNRRWILCLNGWVEYGYSSTNYAAYQAGLVPEAPTVEVWRNGQWVTIADQAGYPAGICHWMTLDLTGKLQPSDRRLRIRSSMELYWDRIYLAEDLGPQRMQQHVVELAAADLHYYGYPREYSPDGRRPNWYDYANPDQSVSWK